MHNYACVNYWLIGISLVEVTIGSCTHLCLSSTGILLKPKEVILSSLSRASVLIPLVTALRAFILVHDREQTQFQIRVRHTARAAAIFVLRHTQVSTVYRADAQRPFLLGLLPRDVN